MSKYESLWHYIKNCNEDTITLTFAEICHKRRKRAVAYVRVSTASSAQLHSYEFQEQYWHDKLDGDPNVELIHIYADLGISGSSMDKRPQLLAMMRDARAGKFESKTAELIQFHFPVQHC